MALCIPFDPDYRPDLHPVSEQTIRQAMQRWQDGNLPAIIVYPRGIWFVVSDDYIPLFAALRGQPDYVPCWILGKPDNDLLKDTQGPFDPKELTKALGLES